MFEILDIAIGLFFVYLVLSLVCTAAMEYVAALTNKRGKALIRGIEQLLHDTDAPETARRVVGHRLIRDLYTPGWLGSRKPSYIPARTFAMALLDVMGYSQGAAGRVQAPAAPAQEPPQSLDHVIQLLRGDASLDVAQILAGPGLPATLEAGDLPEEVRLRMAETLAGARTEFQRLHDSVEVWYNNAMDRVSGAYKRYTQYMLFGIGALVAVLVNADTVQIWRTLATDDDLRESVAAQVVQELSDTTLARMVAGAPGRAPDMDTAQARIRRMMGELEETGLPLGWTRQQGAALGMIRPTDPAKPDGAWAWRSPREWGWGAIFYKVLGLLATALALSLGAPFWFDTLNRIVSIRSAGRAPHEKPTPPEVAGKRPAEQPIK